MRFSWCNVPVWPHGGSVISLLPMLGDQWTVRPVLQFWSVCYGHTYQSNNWKIFKSTYILSTVVSDNTASGLILESGISDDVEWCFWRVGSPVTDLGLNVLHHSVRRRMTCLEQHTGTCQNRLTLSALKTFSFTYRRYFLVGFFILNLPGHLIISLASSVFYDLHFYLSWLCHSLCLVVKSTPIRYFQVLFRLFFFLL